MATLAIRDALRAQWAKRLDWEEAHDSTGDSVGTRIRRGDDTWECHSLIRLGTRSLLLTLTLSVPLRAIAES